MGVSQQLLLRGKDKTFNKLALNTVLNIYERKSQFAHEEKKLKVFEESFSYFS